MTAAELRRAAGSATGRANWDREALYTSLVEWGRGSVVPVRGRPVGPTALRRLCRVVAQAGRLGRSVRTSAPIGWLRDVSQIEPVVVGPDVEMLYGNIRFPVAPGVPTVWSTQGLVPAPGRHLDQSAATHVRLGRRAAMVQCWSRTGRDRLLERADVLNPERVVLVPPLLRLPTPETTPVDPGGSETGPVRLLFVGGDGWLKNLGSLLDAVDSIDDVVLDVVTSSQRPDRVPPHVRWLGPQRRSSVNELLAASDVHVLPSEVESYGVVVLEAMAAAVAQVVVAGTVPAELAGDGAEIAVTGEPDALREAIEVLASDPTRRVTRGDAGRNRYRSEYAPEVVGPRLSELFERACS